MVDLLVLHRHRADLRGNRSVGFAVIDWVHARGVPELAMNEEEAPPKAPDAGTTQELSREEILAFLERMKKEGPEPEPRRS